MNDRPTTCSAFLIDASAFSAELKSFININSALFGECREFYEFKSLVNGLLWYISEARVPVNNDIVFCDEALQKLVKTQYLHMAQLENFLLRNLGGDYVAVSCHDEEQFRAHWDICTLELEMPVPLAQNLPIREYLGIFYSENEFPILQEFTVGEEIQAVLAVVDERNLRLESNPCIIKCDCSGMPKL